MCEGDGTGEGFGEGSGARVTSPKAGFAAFNAAISYASNPLTIGIGSGAGAGLGTGTKNGEGDGIVDGAGTG